MAIMNAIFTYNAYLGLVQCILYTKLLINIERVERTKCSTKKKKKVQKHAQTQKNTLNHYEQDQPGEQMQERGHATKNQQTSLRNWTLFLYSLWYLHSILFSKFLVRSRQSEVFSTSLTKKKKNCLDSTSKIQYNANELKKQDFYSSGITC